MSIDEASLESMIRSSIILDLIMPTCQKSLRSTGDKVRALQKA